MKNSNTITVIILISLMVFFHRYTIGQSSSSSFHFCALNGTCYNEANNDNPLASLIFEEYSSQQIIDETEAFSEAHPDYTIVAPVQADLQSAGLEYQHLQCEKKALLNLLKPLYLPPKQQSNAMKDTINKGVANPHTQHQRIANPLEQG